MYCTTCGKPHDDGMKFCPHCGIEVNAPARASNAKAPEATIKCGNCSYVGPGEKARNPVFTVLAWLCVVFAPLITIIYFLATNKYRCPKCKSTFVGIENVAGEFTSQNGGTSRTAISVLMVLVGIALLGIMASVVLASLNAARQKAADASTKAEEATSVPSNTESFNAVTDSVNKSLPSMVDSETRADSTYYNDEDHSFNYHLTLIHFKAREINFQKLRDGQATKVRNTYCTDHDLAIFRDKDIQLVYHYFSADGVSLGAIAAGPGDCLSFNTN